jgi:hypothetical protein
MILSLIPCHASLLLLREAVGGSEIVSSLRPGHIAGKVSSQVCQAVREFSIRAYYHHGVLLSGRWVRWFVERFSLRVCSNLMRG